VKTLQLPLNLASVAAGVPGGAWKTIPSWYIVASEDRAINPELERFYAKRIGATTRDQIEPRAVSVASERGGHGH